MMGNDRQTCVLGIDAGGTKIRYGFITVKGEILACEEYRSHSAPANVWLETLFSRIDPFLTKYGSGINLIAVGIGIRGSVDHVQQRLRSSSIVLDAGGCDLCGRVSARYCVPAFMENDVKAAALYELMFGWGRQRNTFACINVGTGLAMGLGLEGKLVHGIHNNAGEIGNMLFQRCDSGEIVRIETIASGQGIDLERNRQEAISGPSPVPKGGRALVEAHKTGDPFAKKVIDAVIRHLAILLLDLEACLDIGTYILVGGVMADPWMRARLSEEIAEISARFQKGIFKWNARIEISALGTNNVGLCGSACVAFYNLGNSAQAGCAAINE